MKQRFFIIVVITVLSAASVISLYWFSDRRQHSGDFYRRFPGHAVIPSSGMTIAEDFDYIAGANYQGVYIGSRANPLRVLRVSKEEFDTSTIAVNIEQYLPLEFVNIRVVVDSSYFFMLDGSIPFILRGCTDDWVATDSLALSLHFTDIAALTGSSFAFRTISASKHENVIGKIGFDRRIEVNDQLLQKQLDGIFCTDGILRYNDELSRLIYLYYYRNQFIVADTNLNLESRLNTIDTFAHVQIKSSRIVYDGHQSHRLASPPAMINRHCSTYSKWFLVVSNVQSLNETNNSFQQSSVVDVYNLLDKRYEFSFYLPNVNGKLSDIHLSRNQLFVLYKGALHVYRINNKFFN